MITITISDDGTAELHYWEQSGKSKSVKTIEIEHYNKIINPEYCKIIAEKLDKKNE